MEESKALIPIKEQAVDFYGDELIGALVEVAGEVLVYVPLRPICDYLGVSWSGQRERTLRDAVLKEEVQFVRVTRMNSEQRRGNPNIFCLPLDFLNGWLFGINATRVKPEHQEKVIRYQRECYRVLYQTFHPQAVTVRSEDTSSNIQVLEQIRANSLAVAHLAEQQIEIEQKINLRIENAGRAFNALNRRVSIVEQKLNPAMLVTEDQAETISTTVKALAELIYSKDSSKNHYQGIFAELYRRFGVSSYKNVRIERYQEVLTFLEDWRQSVSR